ncbi:MAG: hybrid sensor histidine kinase/response regulator [Methylobacter sp.]|nr:MAG: hybrid sensor histidine kinase/response regulator [Methylobacter sp.]
MALDIKKFQARFVEEARDHVTRLGDGLDALARNPSDSENINSIFRSAHTIKGSSRMLKLITITDTAHQLEDVLGALREGSLAYSQELGRLLYRGVDGLSALVEKLAEGGELPAVDEALCKALALAAKGENPSVQAATASPPESCTAEEIPALQTVAPATEPGATPPSVESKLKAPDTVRVKMNKLDELINLMGEVISSHARSHQRLLDIREIELMDFAAANAAEADRTMLKTHLHRFAQTLRDDVLAQELLMNELHSKALIMRMLPLSIVFDPVGRMVRELADSLGKDVECIVSGSEIELDRQLIDKLSDPVLHLLRNAVDHGIEPPAVRQTAGKCEPGRITLSARQDGGWVVIEIADNGRGIPIEAIREKAVRKGFVTEEKAEALSEQEIIDLIFLPGFSTSPIITGISGRGVGMDVVKRCIVDDLQGVVNVESRPGIGATFALRLPLSLAMMRVLLVEVGGIPFGFSAQYVTELLRVPQSELLNVAERQAVIIRNEFVPVVPLEDMLRIPPQTIRKASRSKKQEGLLLLVVHVRSDKLAFVVNDLLDERDMVIKPLPEHMRRLTMVSGIVTTGKNELVDILHVPVLLEMSRSARGETSKHRVKTTQGMDGAPLRVLVVDDSLNTREIEKDVLEAHGYLVTLAEDGLDGLRKAQSGDFDAVLTDVEMPNMDGFTLTERLRGEDKYRDTPIIIITSREKEEDKRRGIQVGADAYIVKGDFDQSNLVDILRNLLG